MTDLRRLLGVDVQYFGSWETQQRGLLHRHVLLWAAGISERRMRAAFRLLARRHDFGRVLDLQAISGTDARQFARTSGYLASYVTKGSERAICMDTTTGELRMDGSGYRAWSASRRWGDTIAAIKAQRVAFAASRRWMSTTQSGAPPGAEGALDLEKQIYAQASAIELLFRLHLGAQLM